MADETNKNGDTPGDWLQQAQALREQAKWDDVISLSSSVIPALKTNDDKALAYIWHGYAYRRKGEYDRAIADFNKAMELKPDYAIAYNNRGSTYNDKGEYDRAIADFNKAIELKPDYASAYYYRGDAYSEKGEYDRAIADYNKVIELNPDYATAYNNRGYAYRQKGELDRAIADYSKAIELKSDDATIYHNRGYAYDEKGEYDRAIADYDKAIELKPDNAIAYHNRGYAYKQKGEYDRAIADYNKAIELKPHNATAYNNRGDAYNKKGKYDLAIADYSKAIELNPSYAAAYNSRATTYAAKGEHDKATADWEKALKLTSKDTVIHENILSEMKAVVWSRKQITEELKSAKGFRRREKRHAVAQERLEKRLENWLPVLFVFYFIAFAVVAVLLYCKKIDAWGMLPWITVIFLTSSPIIWAVRILNRQHTRHFALRENAYANWLMALLIFDTPKNERKERAELVKKFFDHHDLRGSPQLILGTETEKKNDESVMERIINFLRQGGGKGD